MISTGKKKRNSTDGMTKPTSLIQYNKFVKRVNHGDQFWRTAESFEKVITNYNDFSLLIDIHFRNGTSL